MKLERIEEPVITKAMLHDLGAAYELGFGTDFMAARPEKRKTFLAIRSLIESSDIDEKAVQIKGSGGREETTPSALKTKFGDAGSIPAPALPSPGLSVEDERALDTLEDCFSCDGNILRRQKAALAHLRSRLAEGNPTGCGNEYHLLMKPAPPSEEERRDMEGWLDGVADHFRKYERADCAGWWETLDKIRALILTAPVTVTRKEVEGMVMEIMDFGSHLKSATYYLERMFCEKGVEVEEK